MPPANTIEKFWGLVDKTNDCWLWKGDLDRHGYGFFSYHCVRYQTHKFAYLVMVGDVPDGLELDHQCNNPRCVRPDHLKPMTCTATQAGWCRGRTGRWQRVSPIQGHHKQLVKDVLALRQNVNLHLIANVHWIGCVLTPTVRFMDGGCDDLSSE